MELLILLLLFLLFYPFSYKHFFSPSHPDILFVFSHANSSHFLTNSLSLLLLWFICRKMGINQKKLVLVFFYSSFSSLFISYLFSLPVVGSSVGIYGMIGFILPELNVVAPIWVSYPLIFLIILIFEPHYLPWSKLFHVFGFNFGLVLRYFFDYRKMKYLALLKSQGLDYYSLFGIGYYPGKYLLEYEIKK